jgi:hypothetical protein
MAFEFYVTQSHTTSDIHSYLKTCIFFVLIPSSSVTCFFLYFYRTGMPYSMP